MVNQESEGKGGALATKVKFLVGRHSSATIEDLLIKFTGSLPLKKNSWWTREEYDKSKW